MPFEVFISHSLKDKAIAEAVCAKLEAAKVRCWIAPRDINPGADWAESIIAALRSCKVMILIFSANADASPQVRREVQRAFEKGLIVMPFRIEDVQPSDSLEYYIGSVHWLDALTDPMEEHIDQLVIRVKALKDAGVQTEETGLGSPQMDEGPDVAVERPQEEFCGVENEVVRKQGKGGLIAVLAVLVIAGAAAAWWFGIGQRAQVAVTQPPAAPAASPAPAPQVHTAPVVARAQTPAPTPHQEPVVIATKDRPWRNSLHMRFVPVPGTRVLFSVWDTRVTDFRAYAQGSGYQQKGGVYDLNVVKVENGTVFTRWDLDTAASWDQPGFTQGALSPVVGVSWLEAQAFCAWLTKKDRAEGRIGADQFYRLPTDAEWTAAVGSGTYPWGNAWPPPPGAGNYADEAYSMSFPGEAVPEVHVNDGYARTSPVGSFLANPYGLYDMGGNVWELCEDWYRASMNDPAVLEKFSILRNDGGGQTYHVLRGGSWSSRVTLRMLSSCRDVALPEVRYADRGFRCVLAGVSAH
jgi:formylglycine-generating enzyme required for sulfatase activity